LLKISSMKKRGSCILSPGQRVGYWGCAGLP
jgi:hypothetical protein